MMWTNEKLPKITFARTKVITQTYFRRSKTTEVRNVSALHVTFFTASDAYFSPRERKPT